MRRTLPFAFLLLLLLGPVHAASGDNYPRSSTIDVIHYRVRLEIREASEDISAETGILAAFTNDGVNAIALDFAGPTIEQVTEDGRKVKFRHADGKLTITLEGHYRRADRCWLAVKYRGRPADGLIIKRNKLGHTTIFADNWPNRAHYWIPSIDHPYDKATVEFFVTAPDRYDVVANGALQETTSNQDGTKLTHWSESMPIPTYCMVIGAAEFAVIHAGSSGGIPLIYYLYPRDREKGLRGYGRAQQIFEFFTSLIGPYPYEKLALVESTTRFGGMENSSNIFFDEKAFDTAGRLEGTVAHEIAHQWFGDSVTESDWHHLWLSEGFATYFGHLFFERADGRDKFVQLMLADKERYLKSYRDDPRPIFDPRINNLMSLLNPNNYEKGGWLLHMLRHIMGEPQFFAGIRDYYRTFRDRNALTTDLQRVMEFQAGRSLDWFFNQWFNEPGYPIYQARWRWEDRAKELELRVIQKQQGIIFRMPLDLEIKLGNTTRREVIEVREREQTFRFKLDSRPHGLLLDPNEWVLKELELNEVSEERKNTSSQFTP